MDKTEVTATTISVCNTIIEARKLEFSKIENKKFIVRVRTALNQFIKGGLVTVTPGYRDNKVYYKIYKPNFTLK